MLYRNRGVRSVSACARRRSAPESLGGPGGLASVPGRSAGAVRRERIDHGQIYTIMTVHPAPSSFTVFRNGMLFVNHGPGITRATGLMVCTPRPVRQK